jgi:hypothetical protein
MKIAKTLISVILVIVFALSLPLTALAHNEEVTAQGTEYHELFGLTKEEYEELEAFLAELEAAGGVIEIEGSMVELEPGGELVEVEGMTIRLFDFNTDEEIESFRLESLGKPGGVNEIHLIRKLGYIQGVELYLSHAYMKDVNSTIFLIASTLGLIPYVGLVVTACILYAWTNLQSYDKKHGIGLSIKLFPKGIISKIWSQEP